MSYSRNAVLAALLLAGSAGAALAHSYPKTSTPAPGSAVQTAPGAVVIEFTEELEPRFSSLKVFNAHHQEVDKRDAHLAADDAKHFSVDLAPLPPGTYTVVWHATSTDTHKTHGHYHFTVAQ